MSPDVARGSVRRGFWLQRAGSVLPSPHAKARALTALGMLPPGLAGSFDEPV